MKSVTFIHTADLHLDLPVRGWRGSEAQLAVRRDDYRSTFRRIVDLCGERDADFLLIAGDFLEHDTVKRQTAEWAIAALERIPHTRVLIAPGNHDPLRGDSFYRTLSWPGHVHIFSGEWEDRWYPEFNLRIFGRGFTQYEEPEASPPAVTGGDGERRLMLVHGTFQPREADSPYYPLPERLLEPLEMDYIAMGHFHRPQEHRLNNGRKTRVRYPGSPEALGWKETGERTVTLGRFADAGLSLETVAVESRRYEVDEADVTGCVTEEELLARVLDRIPPGEGRESCRRLILRGRRSGDFDLSADWLALQLAKEGFFYVDTIDHTIPDYDLEKLAEADGLAGGFVRRMQARLAGARDGEREMLQRALHRGLDALFSPEVNRR